MVLLSTHNICFGEIRKLIFWYTLLTISQIYRYKYLCSVSIIAALQIATSKYPWFMFLLLSRYRWALIACKDRFSWQASCILPDCLQAKSNKRAQRTLNLLIWVSLSPSRTTSWCFTPKLKALGPIIWEEFFCFPFMSISITVNVLKFRTLVACQKGLEKQSRSRSDCFWRSQIRVFPVYYSVKHFVTSSPDNQYFIVEQKEKNIRNLQHLTYYHPTWQGYTSDQTLHPFGVWFGSALFSYVPQKGC